jgi:hypothetical protein
MTHWSAGLTLFFWALPFLLRHVGVQSPADVDALVQAAHQLAVPVGTILVVIGRMRATQPIQGVFQAPAPQDPPY